MSLASLLADVRDQPIAVTLEVGTVVLCVLVFLATFSALAAGPAIAPDGLWLAVIVVGAALVVLWTAIVPVYERFFFDP